MIIITRTFLYFFLMSMINSCSTTSLLIDRLRKEKTILFQSTFSSPTDIHLNDTSRFSLTCSFLSNFDTIDIFWLHNGKLIQSFISTKVDPSVDQTTLHEEEEDPNSFSAFSIVSTMTIENVSSDINGFYQCIAGYEEIHAQQTFDVQSKRRILSTPERYFTVHTSQALFEPRQSLRLICREGSSFKEECHIQWFDPRDQLLIIPGEGNDLLIKNGTFDDHQGLYTCQICCSKKCRKLTSFVYPAEKEN